MDGLDSSPVELGKGENAPIPAEALRLRLVVSWETGETGIDVDASALLLGADGRVRSDDDLVFYNQPSAVDGAVQYLGETTTDTGSQESLAVDLEGLPADVSTIAVTASASSGSFRDVDGLRLLVLDPSGSAVLGYRVSGAEEETALLLGEVYRRGADWKFRAVGQGWSSGLAGLARDFGVTVDDEPTAPEASTTSDSAGDVAPTADGAHTPDPDLQGESAELVEVVEDQPAEALATVHHLPAPSASIGEPVRPARDAPSSSRGVRTRKQPVRAAAPVPRLAGDDSWTPARLFSISGVGSADEQEKRATSALLSTMMAVRPFGRGIAARLGAPAGAVETFLEVQFPLGEAVAIPDGVVRVARGQRLWTGLLETKTGSGQLRRDQVEKYLDIARAQGFDAVVTLSNEIAPSVGEHPVEVDRRKLAKVALFHLSWAEVLHEAQMVLTHRGVEDPMQAWVLSELVRYLSHPRSGAAGFEDMGASWVPVRDAVSAGTLRAGDRRAPAVVDAWTRLIRHLCLRLTAELGVPVTNVLPRKLATDAASRLRTGTEALAANGTLSATLRVPGAVGPLSVVADLRTTQVRVGITVAAPSEGTAGRRIGWLLRQLKDAPDDVLVDVAFAGGSASTCELLGDARTRPAALAPPGRAEVTSFTLSRGLPLGTKRSGLRGAFVPSVTQAVETFYGTVVQPLRPWVPRAPQLPEDAVSAEPVVEEEPQRASDAVG